MTDDPTDTNDTDDPRDAGGADRPDDTGSTDGSDSTDDDVTIDLDGEADVGTDSATGGQSDGGQPTGDATTVEKAVQEIRREGYKAALLHATVDAVAVLLLIHVVFARVEGATLPSVGPVDGALAVGALAAAVTFGVEMWLRLRWYTLERFEAANPVVADALRTAHEAASTEQASVMARRLYRDVTARLSETDSTAFVHTRWLATSVVLVLLLSALTLGTGIAGVQFSLGPANATDGGGPGGGGPGGPGGGSGSSSGDVQSSDSGRDQLRDGSEVLGDLKEVESGTEEIGANISSGQGSGDGDQSRQIYDEGTGSGDTNVDAQRAGFEDDRNLEDADLVRDYNLRLQARDDDDN
jgi:hypothetical protein